MSKKAQRRAQAIAAAKRAHTKANAVAHTKHNKLPKPGVPLHQLVTQHKALWLDEKEATALIEALADIVMLPTPSLTKVLDGIRSRLVQLRIELLDQAIKLRELTATANANGHWEDLKTANKALLLVLKKRHKEAINAATIQLKQEIAHIPAECLSRMLNGETVTDAPIVSTPVIEQLNGTVPPTNNGTNSNGQPP